MTPKLFSILKEEFDQKTEEKGATKNTQIQSSTKLKQNPNLFIQRSKIWPQMWDGQSN